jgi:hypothetical protein
MFPWTKMISAIKNSINYDVDDERAPRTASNASVKTIKSSLFPHPGESWGCFSSGEEEALSDVAVAVVLRSHHQ